MEGATLEVYDMSTQHLARYLLMQLLSTVLVVPICQSIAESINCVRHTHSSWDGGLSFELPRHYDNFQLPRPSFAGSL